MPVYNYKAINRSGKTVKNSLEAASLDSAKSSLRSAGYTLLDIKEQGLLDKDIEIPFWTSLLPRTWPFSAVSSSPF